MVKIIIILSLEKFNELFDNINIECYNNRKYNGKLKLFSFKRNNQKIFNKKYNHTNENNISLKSYSTILIINFINLYYN